MSHKQRSWIWAAIGISLLALAVGPLRRYPWSQTGAALLQANGPLLVAALGINLLSLFAKGWAWSLLLRPVAPHRWRSAQEATLLGCAVNNLSVSVMGEAGRIGYLVRRDGVPFGVAATSLVWARAIEAAALAIVLLAASVVLPLPPVAKRTVVGIAAGILALFAAARLGRGRGVPRWLPESLRRLGASLAEIGSLRRLAWPLVLALVNWLVEWETFDLTLRAVHAQVSRGASLGALLATNLAGSLRATPANVGVFQASMVVGLLPFGVASAQALAAALLLQALQVFPILILAGMLVGWRGIGGTHAISRSAKPVTPAAS
jgi:uncharacterized membrane protein YbhN (UPF0104 family)